MTLATEPMTERDLNDAATLLVAREVSREHVEPPAPARLDDRAVAAEVITRSFERADAETVVARRDGRLAGYMIGSRILPSPVSVDANFVSPRATFIDDVSSAAEDDDPVHVYRTMYAALAER